MGAYRIIGVKLRAVSVADMLFVALCVAALIANLKVVAGLTVPSDGDNYRDIAFAQAFRDGDWYGDPFYRGESRWYNPLLPALVALIAWTLHAPVEITYTQAGPWLNLLSPVAFYLLARKLLGPWPGVGALAGYLFVTAGEIASPAAAQYSPWLFPENLAQGVFFLAAMLWLRARAESDEGKSRLMTRILLGLALGGTFLAHAAPAIQLALLLGLDSWDSIRAGWADGPESDRVRKALAGFFVPIGTAFVLSLPFMWPILFRYHLRVLNPAPGGFIDGLLEVKNIGLLASLDTRPLLAFVISMIGFAAITLERRDNPGRRLLLRWAAICAAFVAYGYLRQVPMLLDGPALPAVIPEVHFHIYLKAAQAMFFGVGVVALARTLLGLAFRHRLHAAIESGAVVLLIGVSIVVARPLCLKRIDYTSRDMCLWHMEHHRTWENARRWLRANTSSGDVVLARTEQALWIVGPSNRKIIVTNAAHSSPYIDWEPRRVAYETMYRHIEGGRFADLRLLFHHYDVSYILADADEPAIRDPAPNWLREAFRDDGLRIYALGLPPVKPIATFGRQIAFLGLGFSPRSGASAPVVSLHFDCLAPLRGDYIVWFHAWAGEVMYQGQMTGFDRQTDLPTSKWIPGVSYRHDVALEVPPGTYLIEFGFYQGTEDSRLPVDGTRDYRSVAGPVRVE